MSQALIKTAGDTPLASQSHFGNSSSVHQVSMQRTIQEPRGVLGRAKPPLHSLQLSRRMRPGDLTTRRGVLFSLTSGQRDFDFARLSSRKVKLGNRVGQDSETL